MSSELLLILRGADFEPFFSKYVSGLEKLPFTEYFGDAGLAVDVEEGLPNANAVAVTITKRMDSTDAQRAIFSGILGDSR